MSYQGKVTGHLKSIILILTTIFGLCSSQDTTTQGKVVTSTNYFFFFLPIIHWEKKLAKLILIVNLKLNLN